MGPLAKLVGVSATDRASGGGRAWTWDAESASTSGTANHRTGPSTARPSGICWRYRHSRRTEIADRRRSPARSTTQARSCRIRQRRSSAGTPLRHTTAINPVNLSLD